MQVWRSWTAAHPAVSDRRQRRVLRLVAAWHLVGMPVGPLIAVHLLSVGLFEPLHWSWLVGSQVITWGGYVACRSRVGPASLRAQVAALTLMIATTSTALPDSTPAMMALMLPVLTAGICLSLTELLATQAMVVLFIAVKTAFVGGLDPSEVGGIMGVLFSGFVLSTALVWQRDGMIGDERAAAQKQAGKARALLDAAFDGTAIVRGGFFTEVSQGFAETLGLDTRSLTGRAVSDATPFLEGAAGLESAVPMLDAAGSLRYVDVVRQPLEDDGQGTMLIAVRDETRNTLHRSKLQFVDRMTALGTLSAGVAHEVNNALHSVLGQVEISTLKLKRGDLSKMERSLAIIERGGQRISDVMQRLQRFSMTPDTVSRPLDLGAVVASTVELARHRIRHAADLEVDIAEGLPLVVGVESHIAQVVMNLLLNAADAAQQSEQQKILVQVVLAKAGDGVELWVSDSGAGIPAAAAERIFQPFYTTKKDGKGSGLGLAISASITAQMGAMLTIEPGPLRGASFVLRIPIAGELADSSAREFEQPLSESDLILIVDDEPEVIEVMSELLKPAQVCGVASADEARRIWSPEFSWVISDIVMPKESGLALREWFVQDHPEVVNRFLLMTGSAMQLEEEVAGLPSSQVVLRKPLGRLELLEQISRVKRRFQS